MKHELPPLPTRPLPMFKDLTGGIYLYDGLTMDKQAFAYAKQCIEPLQNRIAELDAEIIEQARIVGMGAERELSLLADFETAKRRIAALQAKLASGQEPVAKVVSANGGSNSNPVVIWFVNFSGRTPNIKEEDWLFAHPAPAQKPLNRDQILDLYEETDPLCSLFTFRDIVADVESEHNIKDKP
jgi:hypothetical protein